MKSKILILCLVAVVMTGCGGKGPNRDVRDANEMRTRYSIEMINARMSAWYNKDAQVGFPNANSTNGIIRPEVEASWDYVPGVVAKGILDVWTLYQDSAWADAWYEGLCEWGLRQTATDQGGILDDLNCTKVFLGLYEGAKPGGRFENAENAAYFMEQLRRGARGMEEHAANYTIAEGGAAGGWMHKATADPTKSYWGQMWCDGAYMGPALLAQLIVAGATEGTNLGWNDVYDQFEASWPYLWDEEKKLPYHVIFTDIKTNKNARAIYEAGHAYACNGEWMNGGIYHSEEYWGRAAGWYMMALVDVLEAYLLNLEKNQEKPCLSVENANASTECSPSQKPKKQIILPSAQHFDEMREMLTKLADGLVARQDPETGCWYQLLAYDSTKCATQGVDATGSEKYTNVEEGGTQCNYLESSASCLITAALLKGSRLGLIDHVEAGKRGYEGIVKQFVRGEGGEMTITSSCQSAGLSKDRWGNAAYYLIGKDVPIQDNGEGKVIGAFLMAAAEYERVCTNSVNL
jgi:unsaturated rhamnogalacturonyl hydrolase